MTANNYLFDFRKIFEKLLQSWKFIAGFILVSLIVGALFYFIAPTEYKASTSFILRDPLETERNQMLSTDYFQNKKYFADEVFIDEVMALSKSSEMKAAVVEHFDLYKVYGDKAVGKFTKNLEIIRNDTREIDIKYTDKDKNLGANIANFTRDYLEKRYEDYFKSLHRNIIVNPKDELEEIDRHILQLNDSINTVRAEYGLNQQLLPSRNNSMQSERGAVSLEGAKGMEILVGFTQMKDNLNEKRAEITTLIHEYSIGLKEENSLGTFNIIDRANPDNVQMLPNPKLFFPAILLAAFALACIVVLIKGIKQS